MGRLLFHAAALAGSGVAGFVGAGSNPVAGGLAAALLYLGLRALGRRETDAWGRRLVAARSGLEGEDRKRLLAALDVLDRGSPDVARSALAALGEGRTLSAGPMVSWGRACLRLVTHRGFALGPPERWAGVTAGRRRSFPRLERSLLAPVFPADEPALAAEAAVVDDGTLAAILGVRAMLVGALLPAVGNPLHPFFPRSEQDLERLLGRRFLWFPRARLAAAARALQPARPLLPPREEAAVLFLSHGHDEAAAALLATADAAGTLTRRGRALRSACLVLLFLRDGGEVAVTPELFARKTREILFLHTAEFAMTEGSPLLDSLPDGPRRLLALLREKRRFVEALGAQWARRPALGRPLGALVRRVAAGPGAARAPRSPRRFLRWWRTRGRAADEACGYNLRGLLLLREGRSAEAVAEFERALALDPALAAAAFNLAVAREESGIGTGDPADALRKIADGALRGSRVRLLLGEFLERADRPGEAEREYRRLLERDPMNPDANLALGRLLARREDPEGAEEALRRALAARTADPDALVSLALVHLDAGRPADAVPLLRTAVEGAEGDQREEARYLLHVAFRDAEDHEKALETLDAVPDRYLRRDERMLEEAALYLEERSRFDRAQRLHDRLRELRARRGEL